MIMRATLIMLLAIAMYGPIHAEEPVYFVDSNLKAAVEAALGITDPTPTDMLGLTGVASSFTGITDLTGLEYATNLTDLGLGGNNIKSIWRLAGLTNLRYVWLWENQISDISPVSGWTNIECITIFRNQIIDISPLAGLTNLNRLDLLDNQIIDISPLSGLTKLATLRLDYNQISDVSSLAGLTNLERLDFSNNQIIDISPLASLTNLNYLYLRDNQISDIYCLSGLTKLAYLNLVDNPLNRAAYCQDFQVIKNTNPRVSLWYGSNRNPPIGVSASDGTYTDKVQITWEALCPGPGRTNTFKYMVYRSTSLAGVKDAISSWLSGTSFDDTTTSPEIHYYYWVQSIYSTPFSDADEGWCSTSPLIQKPTVSTQTANPVDQNSATLWGKVENDGNEACQYQFRYKKSGDSSYTYTLWNGSVTTGEAFSEDINNLDPNSVYCFNAQAKNSAGESEGNVETFETLPLQRTLTISSNRGGCVVEPGEGGYACEAGTNVTVQAGADPNFQFIGWTGSAVDAGKVADPNAPTTKVTVDADYTLRAIFATKLDILYVDDDAPADPCWYNPLISDPNEDGGPNHPFDEIREAIDVSLDGVMIVVRPGTYYETIDFGGKAITITGFEPNLPLAVYDTVIDANGLGTVVTFDEEEDANIVLSGLVITGGKGSQAGGIYCSNSSPTISNCLIVGNRVTTDAGAAVYCQDCNCAILNCTIADNFCGIYGAGMYSTDSNVVVDSSIIWDNWPQEVFVVSGNPPAVGYSTIQTPVSVDPLFAAPGSWVDVNKPSVVVEPNDPNAMWIAGDYHLKSEAGRWDPNGRSWAKDAVTSTCIDAGDPNSDWTAELWPHGGRINMGAYAGTPEASMSLSNVGNIADLNNDDTVDSADFGRLAGNWLTTLFLLAEDLDRNGIVNFTDFALFAENWLAGVE